MPIKMYSIGDGNGLYILMKNGFPAKYYIGKKKLTEISRAQYLFYLENARKKGKVIQLCQKGE